MPTAGDKPPPHSAADYYGFVLTSLFGVIEDAEASNCNPEAIDLLNEALGLLWAEFNERHPGHWER